MDIKKLAELLGLGEDATEEQVMEAVSYTHLDVYKRQALRRGKTGGTDEPSRLRRRAGKHCVLRQHF